MDAVYKLPFTAVVWILLQIGEMVHYKGQLEEE